MHRRAFVLGCFALLMAAGQPVGLAQQSTPSITSLAPSTGHFADSVTIGGSNFGSTQGSSTVTFNGVAAVAFDSWSDTAIVALVPAGATTGPVVVTVAGQASNGVTFTVNRGTGSGTLQITSPADGAVVAPGDTVNVNVSSPDNSTFVAVAVAGIGNISDPVSTLPAQFAITVPSNGELRRYTLTAFGVTTAAAQTSVSITVDVERSTLPQSIAPDMRQFIIQAEGETGAIDLIAHFSDGRGYRVRESSHVTYSSSDPTVATVDASGIVTAVAEGEAQITAMYGPPTARLSVRIPVTVRGSSSPHRRRSRVTSLV